MLRDILKNRYVSRLVGAVGAGATTYMTTGDKHASVLTAVTFLIYGAVHQSAQGKE